MAQTMTRTLPSRDSASLIGRGWLSSSPPGSSSSYGTRPRRHTDLEGFQDAVPRPKSASNLLELDRRYQLRDFDDTFMTDSLQGRHRRDDIVALIDFLRNHAPPSDNFMSVPFSDERDDGRAHWASKVKRISTRSKSVPRPPRQIQLPDSAVSGTTTGGHRHIAISIPFEASPFGDMSKSQYPTPGAHGSGPDSRPKSARGSPCRTFTNDKGVVTVLRTVTEDGETSPFPMPPGLHTRTPSFRVPRTPGSTGRLVSPVDTSSRGSLKGKQPEHFGGLWLGDPDASSLMESRHSRSPTPDQHAGAGTGGKASPKPSQRPIYPARASSMNPSRTSRQQASIDDIISPQGRVDMALPFTSVASHRRSYPDSVASNGDDALLGEAQTAVPVKSTSIIINGNYSRNEGERQETSLHVPLAKPHHIGVPFPDSPLLPVSFDTSLPTPNSIYRTRRDIVRDRKRRDMEIMRNTRQKRRAMKQAVEMESQLAKAQATRSGRGDVRENGNTGKASHDRWEAGDEATNPNSLNGNEWSAIMATQHPSSDSKHRFRDGADEHNGAETNTTASRPTLVPIMVVADIEPRASFENEPFPGPRRALSTAPPTDLVAHHRFSDPSGNPTPPVSASGSPTPKHDSIDRTSLARRREWNANREEERKAREASLAAKARAKLRSSTEGRIEGVRASVADKDILKLYETYRDHRFREMERRVRRLERNGDVWLQALMPFLDNVNRTMATVHDEHDAVRSWASDDEAVKTTQRRSRSAVGSPRRGERMSSRRASLSQGRMLEQLARKTDDAKPWEGSAAATGTNPSGGDDTSGLGTIEPLMRELAGEASRRQKAAERLGVSGNARREVRG